MRCSCRKNAERIFGRRQKPKHKTNYMGLFKDILSGAVSEGLGKAVGKAVEKTVAPAAERLAQKQAEVLDNVAKKTEEAAAKTVAAAEETAEAAKEGAAAAREAIDNADKKELTPEQKAQAEQAASALRGLGMMFSGAIEQAKKEAAAEEEAKKAAEAAIFENWQENLGAYPVWDVGGSEFELEELTPMNGYPAWRLGLKGRPYFMELYMNKLRAAGFVAKGSNPLDLNADTYYKITDGVCHAFNRTDACSDGYINVNFYVDNYVPKPKAESRPQQDLGDLKNVAKGLFKKLF